MVLLLSELLLANLFPRKIIEGNNLLLKLFKVKLKIYEKPAYRQAGILIYMILLSAFNGIIFNSYKYY